MARREDIHTFTISGSRQIKLFKVTLALTKCQKDIRIRMKNCYFNTTPFFKYFIFASARIVQFTENKKIVSSIDVNNFPDKNQVLINCYHKKFNQTAIIFGLPETICK